MRSTAILSLLLVVLTSFAIAQTDTDKDTNFSNGPQYLIPAGSPMLLLHPISTPSLSWGQAPSQDPYVDATNLANDTPPPDNRFLGAVYWGDHSDSEVVGRRSSTPSMTPIETAWYMQEVSRAAGNNASALSTNAGETTTASGLIEITSNQLPLNLPASLLDLGVTGSADATAIRERGYGQPLGDIAAYWKAHKGRASHTYTNDNLVRPHGE